MPSSPLDDVKLEIVRDLDDAFRMKRWLGERRETPVGFDVESGGLDPFRHRLRLIQLGDLRTGWVIPYPRWGGLAKELIDSYKGKLVGHNAGFDHRYLGIHAGIDIPWHRVEDTMVLAAIDDPGRPKGLKPLSNTLIDPLSSSGQLALDEGMRDNGWDWDTVPESYTPWWCYAALDPVLTCHLWKYLHPRVMANQASIYDLEMGTTRVISNMMKTGLLTDQSYIAEQTRKLIEQSREIRAWLETSYGITTPNSGPQVARAFARLGYEIDAVTASGLPRVDKEVLEYIGKTADNQEISDLARYVYGVRHSERVISSYLSNFTKLADSDGVIHCQIWALTARTSRMSVTEPALQTLHRDDKVVRGSFIPRPGHVFVSCDFSQVEMRIAAALSGDEGLIKAFHDADNGGPDFYSGVASELFGERISKDDRRRQDVKVMSLAKLYGAGIATMARSVGMPYDKVKIIHDNFNSRYPGLERLARTTASAAWDQKRNGEQPVVTLPSGRRLPVDKEHASVNYLCQGTAAEVMKRAGLNVEAAGLGSIMRLFLHDELLAEVPAAHAEEYRCVIENTMTDLGYPVPLTCSAKILEKRWVK